MAGINPAGLWQFANAARATAAMEVEKRILVLSILILILVLNFFSRIFFSSSSGLFLGRMYGTTTSINFAEFQRRKKLNNKKPSGFPRLFSIHSPFSHAKAKITPSPRQRACATRPIPPWFNPRPPQRLLTRLLGSRCNFFSPSSIEVRCTCRIRPRSKTGTSAS